MSSCSITHNYMIVAHLPFKIINRKIMKNFWKKISEQKPHSHQTGYWDGRMSDEILFTDSNGLFYIGKYYQGVIDGSEFCCFYDQNDFEVDNVTHWAEIPSLF